LAAALPEDSYVILEVPKLFFSALDAKTPSHSTALPAVFIRPEAKLVLEAAEKEVARIEVHDISWIAHSDP
jgi:hypothetical protein